MSDQIMYSALSEGKRNTNLTIITGLLAVRGGFSSPVILHYLVWLKVTV